MSFRTVIISERSKLDYRMNYLEIRNDRIQKIHLDEIEVLIIENPAISLTGCLLEACAEKKIKVIFCDSKHNPQSELISYYGSHDCSRKLKKQIGWDTDIKSLVWTKIVSEKIRNQALFLKELGKEKEAEQLFSYFDEMTINDVTNREGHAAKVYFNALFGMKFTRDDDNVTNAALNYGYSLILSIINRDVVAGGYNTELGLFHDSIFNPFNLSCDLMEPFRIIVDRYIFFHSYTKFEKEEKHSIAELLQMEVHINGGRQVLINAIKIYVKSVCDALNEGELEYISFYEL